MNQEHPYAVYLHLLDMLEEQLGKGREIKDLLSRHLVRTNLERCLTLAWGGEQSSRLAEIEGQAEEQARRELSALVRETRQKIESMFRPK
jgi:hypothetical protein